MPYYPKGDLSNFMENIEGTLSEEVKKKKRKLILLKDYFKIC